jgi:hypothetical protein
MKQTTNNPPDKSPVDDLFARRLGQHSIVPDKAAWERLQSKMAGQPEARVLAFWQNPMVHRYAAAACVSALLLVGGWLLLRPTDGTITRQNQIATAGTSQKTAKANITKKGQSNLENRIKDQRIAVQRSENQGLVQQPATSSVSKFAEKMIAQTRRSEKQLIPTPKPVNQRPGSQLAKTETLPTEISPITIPAKPVAEQVLIVTIAEPDALIEARQAANWSESAEKTLVVDVSAQPTRNNSLFQQLKRVREGNGLELAGNDDQSLLSRAYQTIKKKTNNKSLKQ